MQVVDTIFSDLTLSVIASQCHLSQRERQVRSQIQLLLTVKMPWLPPLGELAKPKALTERVSNFHTKSPRHLATAGAKLQI